MLDRTSQMTRPVWTWHIAVCSPNQDRQAVAALVRRGYRVYRPTLPETVHRRRVGLVQITRSIFPGYLFVLPKREGWEGLRESNVRLLLINGHLATLRDDDPDFRAIEEVEKVFWQKPSKSSRFRVGQKVSVVKGPFVSMVGAIESLDDRGRACVLVDLLKSKVRVSCSEQHLNSA